MPPRGLGIQKNAQEREGTTLRILKYVMNYRYVVLALLMLTVISNLGNLLAPPLPGKAIGAAVGEDRWILTPSLLRGLHAGAAYLFGNIMSFSGYAGHDAHGRRVARKMRGCV